MTAMTSETQLPLNLLAARLFESVAGDPAQSAVRRIAAGTVDGATVVDFGVQCCGSLAAGLDLARICLAGVAEVSLQPATPLATNALPVSAWDVVVTTDHPVEAMLGSQYAGWPVSSDDGYFAMGSGPMRLARGKEKMLESLCLREQPDVVVGVLESDQLPSADAVSAIAAACGVESTRVRLAVAPSTSMAGTIQVVARSVETAMHKLHEVEFDVRQIVSAAGRCPLPPPAADGDSIGGIARTNDAILYGGSVSIWVDVTDDDAITSMIDRVPSQSSDDHGRPFREIFADYDHDFYRVDPGLFAPARIQIHSLRSGKTYCSGSFLPEVLDRSFST